MEAPAGGVLRPFKKNPMAIQVPAHPVDKWIRR
jgi:hypothetical protein